LIYILFVYYEFLKVQINQYIVIHFFLLSTVSIAYSLIRENENGFSEGMDKIKYLQTESQLF